jgi:hypothetical protein
LLHLEDQQGNHIYKTTHLLHHSNLCLKVNFIMSSIKDCLKKIYSLWSNKIHSAMSANLSRNFCPHHAVKTIQYSTQISFAPEASTALLILLSHKRVISVIFKDSDDSSLLSSRQFQKNFHTFINSTRTCHQEWSHFCWSEL